LLLRDRLKMAGFAATLLVPLLGVIGHWIGFEWLAVVVIFGIVPIGDWLIGKDRTNEGGSAAYGVGARQYLESLPALYVLMWIASLLWTVQTLATVPLSLMQHSGLLMAAGISSALATCIAHELVHGRSPLEQGLCRVALGVCWHGLFLLEHKHHHQTVGLVDIGGTPKLGESLWSFAPRCFVQGFRNCQEIERARKATGIRNRILQQAAMTIMVAGVFVAVCGWYGLAVFCWQGVFAIWVVETMTFIQHYGLARSVDQPISARHSWNRNHWLSNSLTLNMTRHSDHHAAGHVHYYELRGTESAPQLPADYFSLFLVAMVTPWWRHLMDARARTSVL
jgi:alkane 1-monooxygenase